jgi:hypothetical protein
MKMENQSLAGVIMVRPLISVTTGTVAFDRAEAGVAAKDLPPSDILSDGRKRIIDPLRLAPLLNCRRRVERLLARHGVPFLGAMLVPEDKFGEIDAELTAIEAEFNSALDALVIDLPSAYAEWEAKHPAWAHFLRTNRLSGPEIRDRCQFRVAAFRPEALDTCPQRSVLAKDAVPAVLQDIAGEATRLLDLIKGRQEVTQKVRKGLERIIAKFYGFSMLDVRIAPCVDGLRTTARTLPQEGPIGGTSLVVLMGLLRLLADPERLLAHGEAQILGIDAEEQDVDLVFEGDEPAPSEQAVPVAVTPPPPLAPTPVGSPPMTVVWSSLV